MLYRNINLPIFTRIENNIFPNLLEIFKKENLYFKNVSILCGNFGYSLVENYKIKKQFEKVNIFKIDSKVQLSILKSSVLEKQTELLLSIGGGRINDIAKYISMETSISLISIPTILSNDGIASPISILHIDNKYRSMGTTPPIGVIADINIIKKANKRFILSGIGDLISNLSATLDWELSHKKIGEKIDNYSISLSRNSALKLLYNNSIGIYENIEDENLIKDLFDGLIMSAISMIIAKSSRPASGAEHNISHALDRLGSKELHGIQVGFATLLTLSLHKEEKLLNSIISLYKKIGFPLNFKDTFFNKEMFIKAVELAPEIRERYTILNENIKDKDLEGIYK